MEKKRNLSLLYLFINIGILIAIIIINFNFRDVDQALKMIDYRWVFASIGLMIIFWILDTIITDYTMRLALPYDMGIYDMFKINAIGRYYASLFPFGGGQVSQIVHLSKRGIPPGKSSSVIMMKFWVHQTALGIYGVFAFLFRGSFIKKYRPHLFLVGIFGFLINIMSPFALYILSSKQEFINKIIKRFFGFFEKGKLRGRAEKLSAKAIKFVDDYSKVVRLVDINIDKFKLPLGLSFLQIAIFYIIPYFIYRGCGLSDIGPINIMLTNIFLHFVVCLIPTPGAAGASEGGFLSLFSLYFPNDLILTAMIFWRLISFYLPLVLGGIIISMDRLKTNKVEYE